MKILAGAFLKIPSAEQISDVGGRQESLLQYVLQTVKQCITIKINDVSDEHANNLLEKRSADDNTATGT